MADVIIEIRPIRGRVGNPLVFQAELIKAVKKELDIIEGMYGRATSTWKHKPIFKTRLGYRQDAFAGIISTDSKPFVYVEEGTKERWALMDEKFTAKSKPKKLSSGPGAFPTPVLRGRKSFRRRKMGPRPGITARDFSGTIVKQREKHTRRRMERAVALAQRKFQLG
jgi:hypothetical protein